MSLREKLNVIDLLDKCWHNIYSSKQKSKRKYSKGSDGISIQDFQDRDLIYLRSLQKSLKDRTYTLAPLGWFLEEKQEKGKFRLITVFNVKDRIVHKAILSLLNPDFFSYIDTKVSYCGVKPNIWKKRENNSLNTKKAFFKIIHHLKNKKYFVFKSDIKGFYDNVPKKKLVNILENLSQELLTDISLMKIIKELINFEIANPEKLKGNEKKYLPANDKGIPQGSSLSQFFANIYLADFDIKMKNKYGDRFIRYIDDFAVFCDSKDEAKEAKKYAIELLKEKELELSEDPNKTKIADLKKDYINFLGLRVDSQKLTYKKNVTETGKYIKEILNEKDKEYAKYPKFSDKVSVMKDRIKGLGEYLKFYHTETIFQEINKWVKDKKRKRTFKGLELLEIEKIKPIISQKNWQTLFK